MIFYADDAVTLHHGDTLEVLRTLPDESVNCVCTSPPYFGLRDYGNPGQYGLESSPAAYVENMRAVFAEVRRVLAKDGTLWLNIGDSYSAKRTYQVDQSKVQKSRIDQPYDTLADRPAKNLLGIPWRTAFALQDDDSGDVYELLPDAPESVRSVIYLETCHTRTLKQDGPTTANTPSVGEKLTQSDTPNDEQPGTKPTGTNSASTAGSTTNSTGSKRSSGRSPATSGDTEGSGWQRSSTTVASSQSAHAVASGDCHSSRSTISTVAADSTGKTSEKPTTESSNGSAERDTPRASECSATTATPREATTVRARTKTRGLRLRKAQIRPEWLQHFRLVKHDRWILRNCIVWSKPNAMPESVTDRLSTRHELLFMFSRSRKYWFDLDPIRDAAQDRGPALTWEQRKAQGAPMRYGTDQLGTYGGAGVGASEKGRNPGDVWEIATTPFPGAHFAVFPPEVPRRCILAGCKTGGTVLDPFSGSGTTGMVAGQLGRKYVGIDLSADYLRLSLETRLAQTALLDGESA